MHEGGPAGSVAVPPGDVAPPDELEPAPRRGRRILVLASVLVLGLVTGAGAVALLDDDEESWGDFCGVAGGPAREAVLHMVFLEPGASARDVEEVGDHLATVAGVEGLTFVTQEEAYQEALELFEDQPTTQEILRVEDVPASWRFGYDGPDLRPELERLPAVRAVERSGDQPVARAVDLLGDLVDGEELDPFRVLDRSTTTALREAAPGSVDESVEVVTGWLPEIATPGGDRDAPAAVRAAARELVTAAGERCGLRPAPSD